MLQRIKNLRSFLFLTARMRRIKNLRFMFLTETWRKLPRFLFFARTRRKGPTFWDSQEASAPCSPPSSCSARHVLPRLYSVCRLDAGIGFVSSTALFTGYCVSRVRVHFSLATGKYHPSFLRTASAVASRRFTSGSLSNSELTTHRRTTARFGTHRASL